MAIPQSAAAAFRSRFIVRERSCPMKGVPAILCAAIVATTLGAPVAAAATPPANFGWLVNESKQNDKPVRWKVRGDIPPGALPAQYPSLIEMHWKYTPDAMGMPAQDVTADLARLEAAIDPIQGDRIAYLMVVVTGNGMRSWLWYAADPKAFASAMNRLIPGHPFPVTLHLGPNEPDWKTYRTMREKVH
jgi:hypothetical protein